LSNSYYIKISSIEGLLEKQESREAAVISLLGSPFPWLTGAGRLGFREINPQ